MANAVFYWDAMDNTSLSVDTLNKVSSWTDRSPEERTATNPHASPRG